MVTNIQVLRIFAAMVVVWHHLQQQLNVYWGAHFFTWWGVSGVDIFFVISGFIMFYTTRGFKRSAGAFWLDRAIRIAPLYWIATWALVALYLAGLEPNGVRKLDAGDVASAMVFWPDIRADGHMDPPLAVGWTLIYEMFFYILFGLTFFLRSHAKSLAVLTGLFVALWLGWRLSPQLPYAAQYLMRPITLEFAAGGLLGIFYGRVKPLRAALAIPLGYALIGLGVIVIFIADAFFHDALNPATELRVLWLGIPAFAIVSGALILESSGHVWRSRTLVLLGAASYAIYLFHPLLVQGLVKGFGAVLPGKSLVTETIAGVFTFAATAVFGVGIHLWLEKPVQRFLKALTHRKVAATSAP